MLAKCFLLNVSEPRVLHVERGGVQCRQQVELGIGARQLMTEEPLGCLQFAGIKITVGLPAAPAVHLPVPQIQETAPF